MKFIKLAKAKSVSMENYKIENKYFKTLDTPILQSLLSQSERSLIESQESIKSINNKANDLFKILIVALFALTGFIFSNNTINFNDAKTIVTLYGIISLFMILIWLYSIIYPKRNYLSGTEPRNIINDIVIKQNYTSNSKRVLFVIIQSNQRSIDKNLIVHETILRRYKLIIKCILFLVFISFVIFLLCYPH